MMICFVVATLMARLMREVAAPKAAAPEDAQLTASSSRSRRLRRFHGRALRRRHAGGRAAGGRDLLPRRLRLLPSGDTRGGRPSVCRR
jgi:hypothetical protein